MAGNAACANEAAGSVLAVGRGDGQAAWFNLTAKTLRLDYTALKQRAFGPAVRQQEISPASFVELVSTQPVAYYEECLIEFTSSRGSTIRIQWKGSVPPDWSKLLVAWRDAER